MRAVDYLANFYGCCATQSELAKRIKSRPECSFDNPLSNLPLYTLFLLEGGEGREETLTPLIFHSIVENANNTELICRCFKLPLDQQVFYVDLERMIVVLSP